MIAVGGGQHWRLWVEKSVCLCVFVCVSGGNPWSGKFACVSESGCGVGGEAERHLDQPFTRLP